jgi:AbiV family abortive infection protein
MRTTLSARKYKQLALESLRNSLRLLKDAMSLYQIGSYPSAFQLAVLSMEEYAKARWVDHIYYESLTNTGMPCEELEQKLLKSMYSHTEKHGAFLWEYFEFSPNLLRAAREGELEQKKQAATYVGLPKTRKRVDVNTRISLPSSIKQADAKQIISLVTIEFKGVYRLLEENDQYFGIESLDEVVMSHEAMFVFTWRHRSGLKSKRFRSSHGLEPLGVKRAPKAARPFHREDSPDMLGRASHVER